MSKLQVHQFPCRDDNYGVLIHCPEHNLTASIDAPETSAVKAALAEKGWTLTHILTTHHHGDHTEGNLPLKEETSCTIVGPKAEASKIPGIDVELSEGDTYQFGDHTAQVFDTPGHTAGHISYLFAADKLAFVGDTMFAMGCGRLFEGDAQTMWNSLSKIAAWDDDVTVYAGHEYTLSNAEFALTVDPENAELQKRVEDVRAKRAAGEPTLPTTMAMEKATNPFLRPSDPGIRSHLAMQDAEDWQVFGEIRARKDAA